MTTRPENHRTGSVGRPNPLNDPDFAKLVAEAFADGCSRQEMCDMFGVKDKDTITRWRRDPRVKVHALKIIEDRVLQISRRVDGVIEGRLQHADDMTIQELISIRKEYVGGALRQQMEKADSSTIEEAQSFLEENPEAAAELDKLLAGDGALPGVEN